MKIPSAFFRVGTGLAAFAASGLARAHSGHGHTEAHELMHVLESEHVVPVLLALAAAVLVLRVIRHRGKRRQTRQDR